MNPFQKAPATVAPITVDTVGLADLLGVSPRHVAQMRSEGKIPEPLQLGRRRFWRRAEVEAWLEAGCPDAATWASLKQQQAAPRS